jgi:hypothetical protein
LDDPERWRTRLLDPARRIVGSAEIRAALERHGYAAPQVVDQLLDIYGLV